MLYKDELTEKTKIIRPIVNRYIEIATTNQTHDQDLFLILINGYYDDDSRRHKLDPYVYGSSWTDIASQSFSDYIKWYTKNEMFTKDIKTIIQYPNPELEFYKISVHTEKSIYLRYWEADTTLQYLYQITRLCQGLHYDWKWKQKIAKCTNRQQFFRDNIKKPLETIDKEIFDFFKETVIGQIRNAIAHSQYCVLNNQLKYLNYSDNPKKHSSLMLLDFDGWKKIFHNTVVFRNELTKTFNVLHKGYLKYAEMTDKKLKLRIVKDIDKIEFGEYELRK
jgi:hypothetical protein